MHSGMRHSIIINKTSANTRQSSGRSRIRRGEPSLTTFSKHISCLDQVNSSSCGEDGGQGRIIALE
jgi:hypothetical protein